MSSKNPGARIAAMVRSVSNTDSETVAAFSELLIRFMIKVVFVITEFRKISASEAECVLREKLLFSAVTLTSLRITAVIRNVVVASDIRMIAVIIVMSLTAIGKNVFFVISE